MIKQRPTTQRKDMSESTEVTQYTAEQKTASLEWIKKKPKATIKLKQKSNDNSNELELRFEFTDNPPVQEIGRNRQNEIMREITGSNSSEYSGHLFTQLIMANQSQTDNLSRFTATANAYKEALLEMKPKDIIEGQLITKMLVQHDIAMKYMSILTNTETTPKLHEMTINRLAKITRLYNESLDTLNKYRRKGEQRVVVQHVNVENGGQAIVGNVTQGGGDKAKN